MTGKIQIPKYDGCGVYAIVNIVEFKVYIGSSHDVHRRFQVHLSKLKNGKHSIAELQKDFNDDFRFIVLHECDKNIAKDDLLDKEYIFMLQFIERGFSLYNTQPFESCKRYKMSARAVVCEHIANRVIYKYYGIADKKIKNEFGTNPWCIKSMTKEGRKKLLLKQ